MGLIQVTLVTKYKSDKSNVLKSNMRSRKKISSRTIVSGLKSSENVWTKTFCKSLPSSSLLTEYISQEY